MNTKPINHIVSKLSTIRLAGVFNPYADYCTVHDLKDAVAIRRKNLRCYLVYQLETKPKQLWLAEAGSYKGLRRTGLPLVPETELQSGIASYDFLKNCHKATISTAIAGYSNTIVWQAATEKKKLPFLWNTIMAQPYKPDHPVKNRTPTVHELNTYLPLMQELQKVFQFEHIICIGRKAERIAQKMDLPFTYVRHPAQGGATAFKSAIACF